MKQTKTKASLKVSVGRLCKKFKIKVCSILKNAEHLAAREILENRA
jgi:hypothetical protein